MPRAHPLNVGGWSFPDMRDLAQVVKFVHEVETESHRPTKLIPNTRPDQSGNIQNRHRYNRK